jgi:hypothetical protein
MKHKGKTQADIQAELRTQKISLAKTERNIRMAQVLNRVDRYRNQKALGVSTTDSDEKYQILLAVLEELRNIPEQAGFPDVITWPEIPV